MCPDFRELGHIYFVGNILSTLFKKFSKRAVAEPVEAIAASLGVQTSLRQASRQDRGPLRPRFASKKNFI